MRVPESGLAINEAQPLLHQVGEGAHQGGVLAPHHQPLHAARARNELVPARFEQRFERAGEHRRRAAQGRHMEAGDQALARIEGTQGINAALKTEIEMQVGGLGDVPLQHRQREIMTGTHGQQVDGAHRGHRPAPAQGPRAAPRCAAACACVRAGSAHSSFSAN